MRVKMTFITIICILFINGCGRFCPELPDRYADYFPYRQGQILKFKNYKNETITWEVSKYSRTKEQYISLCSKCDCDPQSVFFNLHNVSDSVNIYGYLELYDNISVKVTFAYGSNEFQDNSDIFQNKYKNDELSSTLKLKNSDATIKISEIEIQKNKGIVSFYDNELKCEWRLIEKK